MKPIREGDRGPAVEDVQRRLLTLDIDIGPTGVDGVFLGATLTAVRGFQSDVGVAEDGVVGPETWAALVDATFRLGDRLLYLRYPYLHGSDVKRLQDALNTLGFACGQADAIFGAFTEAAVREFQQNVGDPVDGIVGVETVAALTNLRHVWEGKDPSTPLSCKVAPARAAEVLRAIPVSLLGADPAGREVAGRVANLAEAAQADAAVTVVGESPDPVAGGLVLWIGSGIPDVASGMPVVSAPDSHAVGLSARVVTALRSERGTPSEVAVDLSGLPKEERALQAVAVGLLDGLCAGLS